MGLKEEPLRYPTIDDAMVYRYRLNANHSENKGLSARQVEGITLYADRWLLSREPLDFRESSDLVESESAQSKEEFDERDSAVPWHRHPIFDRHDDPSPPAPPSRQPLIDTQSQSTYNENDHKGTESAAGGGSFEENADGGQLHPPYTNARVAEIKGELQRRGFNENEYVGLKRDGLVELLKFDDTLDE